MKRTCRVGRLVPTTDIEICKGIVRRSLTAGAQRDRLLSRQGGKAAYLRNHRWLPSAGKRLQRAYRLDGAVRTTGDDNERMGLPAPKSAFNLRPRRARRCHWGVMFKPFSMRSKFLRSTRMNSATDSGVPDRKSTRL